MKNNDVTVLLIINIDLKAFFLFKRLSLNQLIIEIFYFIYSNFYILLFFYFNYF